MKKGLYQNFAKYYDIIYQSKDDDQVTDYIISIFDEYGNKGKDVMDMACGTGSQAIALEKKGFNVIGVDFNEGMLKVAKKKNIKVKFLQGDMKTYKSKKKFDLITCLFSAINHNKNLNELKKTIGNFHSCLNKGGVLLFDLGFVNKKKDEAHQGCYLDSFTNSSVQIARISQWNISMNDENLYDTQDLILVKENGKVDFEIDRHELGIFEVKDVRKVLEKAGFKTLVFDTWSKKEATKTTRRPIFIGVRN